MARHRKYSNPRNFWSNRDPRTNEYVWIDNDVYSEMNSELSYLRLHPQKADPEAMLRLMQELIHNWNGERDSFKSEWNRLISEYNDLTVVINSQNSEFIRLNNDFINLERSIEQTYQRQNELQNQINEINLEKNRNADLANNYLEDVIRQYNKVAEDWYYRKFVQDELDTLNFTFQNIQHKSIDPVAIQGIALESLSKLYYMNKKVLKKRTEFELLYTAIKEDALELMEQYEYWQSNIYFDQNNSNKADLNYWSQGLFSEYFNALKDISHEIDNAPSNPNATIDDLKDIHKDLVQLRSNGELLVQNVKASSLQSEKIEALAHIATIILVEDFFFKSIYTGFNNDDIRSSYIVQLNNHASGISIQFIFSPLNGGEIGCNYTVSFEGYQDEERVNNILERVWAELVPNKVNPLGRKNERNCHIVDNIEFGTQGVPIQIQERAAIN